MINRYEAAKKKYKDYFSNHAPKMKRELDRLHDSILRNDSSSMMNSLSLKKGIEEAQETQSETVVLLGGHMSHIENTNNLKAAIRAFIKLC